VHQDNRVSAEHRARVRAERAASIVARFHARLEALAPKVLQSLLGRAIH
jgi:hypothetical protein